MNSKTKRSTDEVVLYRSPEGDIHLDVQVKDESVWLSLAQMEKLFGRDKSVIGKHLRNIFKAGELRREAVAAKNAATAADGKTYQIEYFNLDV